MLVFCLLRFLPFPHLLLLAFVGAKKDCDRFILPTLFMLPITIYLSIWKIVPRTRTWSASTRI